MVPESRILNTLNIDPEELFDADTLLFNKGDKEPFAILHVEKDKAVLSVGKNLPDIKNKKSVE